MTRFYAAGMASLDSFNPGESNSYDHLINSILISYFYEGTYLLKAKKLYPHIFVDSGAFSAKTKGVKININDYGKFLKNHEHLVDVYANLDVMYDAEATLKNQKMLEEMGLHPLPVFHINEDIKYLRYYVDNYDYIALGGIALEFSNRDRWLSQIFDEFPNHKFHGFGVSDFNLIKKYSFYSVDSTTWFIGQKFGRLFFKTGEVIHYQELDDNHKNMILDCGISLESMDSRYYTRNLFNLLQINSFISSVKHKRKPKIIYNNITEELK